MTRGATIVRWAQPDEWWRLRWGRLRHIMDLAAYVDSLSISPPSSSSSLYMYVCPSLSLSVGIELWGWSGRGG